MCVSGVREIRQRKSSRRVEGSDSMSRYIPPAPDLQPGTLTQSLSCDQWHPTDLVAIASTPFESREAVFFPAPRPQHNTSQRLNGRSRQYRSRQTNDHDLCLTYLLCDGLQLLSSYCPFMLGHCTQLFLCGQLLSKHLKEPSPPNIETTHKLTFTHYPCCIPPLFSIISSPTALLP
jgi:hypothetical protein